MSLSKNGKTRFGIIGFGAIGPRHKEKIDQIEDAELVAICDSDAEQLKKHEGNGVKLFTDYRDLLALEEIDVVSICTPNHLHAPMTIDAFIANKHVVCEKPMALTSKECKVMVHTALRHNKKLFVVKQNRYNPPIVAVKKLMGEKKLGKLYSIVLNCFWNRNDGYYNGSPWKGKKDLDGGALFTQFSHFIDIMLMLAGSVEYVQAMASNFGHPDIEIEDTGVVGVQFDSGTIGSINYTNCAYQKNMEGSITLFAEHGTIKIGGQYLNELEYQRVNGGEEIKTIESSRGANDYGTYQGSMSNHDQVYMNVMDSVTNGGKVAVSGIEGMWTTELIEAAYRSIESGERVYL